MKRRKKKEAARLLYLEVANILDENDDMRNTGPWLPAKWRVPLVRAVNNFHEVWYK